MKKIVVIKDQPQMRRNICLILTMEGYEIHSAADGGSGLDLIQQHQPDLVICDVRMPGIGGHEVLQRLRADPATATLVITQDIVFNIPSNASAIQLVFRNWATTNGGITQVLGTPAQSLAVSNNGNASLLSINGLYDNNNSLQNDIGINDGLIYLDTAFLMTAGTATIKAGSYTFNSSTDFNPALNGITFNGQVFLTDSSGAILSNIVTVPEASYVALLGLGALALGLKRRR